MYLRKRTKAAIYILLTVFIGGWLMYVITVKPAGATFPVFDPAQWAQFAQKTVTETAEVVRHSAAEKALFSAAEKYLNRMAFETAQFLAQGGPGGTSLKRRESFGEVLRNTSEAALGDFLQDLSADDALGLNKLGLNICNPSARLKAQFSLQLLDQRAPPVLTGSNCNINQILNNWQRLANSADVGLGVSFVTGDRAAGAPWFQLTSNLNPAAKLSTYQDLFSPEQSGLAALLGLRDKQSEIEERKTRIKALGLEACPETYDRYANLTDKSSARAEKSMPDCSKEPARTGRVIRRPAIKLLSSIFRLALNPIFIICQTFFSGLE